MSDKTSVDRIYRVMINSIVDPLIPHVEQPELLHKKLVELRQSDGEGWAIAETAARAMRYIAMTLDVAKEQGGDVTIEPRIIVDLWNASQGSGDK